MLEPRRSAARPRQTSTAAAVIQGGEVRATFLVDGFVAGLWSVEDGRVRVAPFAPLPRTARRDVEDEARRLEAFLRAAGKAP